MLSEAITFIYKDIWVPIIGEILFSEQEPGNEYHFAIPGYQLSKYLGTFNWKFGLLAELRNSYNYYFDKQKHKDKNKIISDN